MPNQATFAMTGCPHCGGSTPMVADFCANCGAFNETHLAARAATESAVASYRSELAGPADIVPPEIEAEFESHGATVEPVETSPGSFLVRLGDLPVATFSSKGVEFADIEVGRTWIGSSTTPRWHC